VECHHFSRAQHGVGSNTILHKENQAFLATDTGGFTGPGTFPCGPRLSPAERGWHRTSAGITREKILKVFILRKDILQGLVDTSSALARMKAAYLTKNDLTKSKTNIARCLAVKGKFLRRSASPSAVCASCILTLKINASAVLHNMRSISSNWSRRRTVVRLTTKGTTRAKTMARRMFSRFTVRENRSRAV
jgi:hypothetical protein